MQTFRREYTRLAMVAAYVGALFFACLAMAGEGLPFWTEKSTYTEGDRLYSVGISRPLEDGAAARQEAFERGTLELMNTLQVSDLSGLTVETQRIVEVSKGAGTQVYRLLYVDAQKALAFKESRSKATRQTLRAQTDQLIRMRNELYPVLEQHREAAKSLRELEAQAQAEAVANETRRESVRGAAGAIERRIASRGRLACEIRPAMTEAEVKALLGEPDKTEGRIKRRTWTYGSSRITFSREGRVSELRLDPGICEGP